MYRIPARDTVAGVAVLKLEISNRSRIDLVKAIRSLLANVSTFKVTNIKYKVQNSQIFLIHFTDN